MGNIIITTEILDAGISRNGGWNGRQIKLLGLNPKLIKGWKDRLVGTYPPQQPHLTSVGFYR